MIMICDTITFTDTQPPERVVQTTLVRIENPKDSVPIARYLSFYSSDVFID
jgi:hypothetical protein